MATLPRSDFSCLNSCQVLLTFDGVTYLFWRIFPPNLTSKSNNYIANSEQQLYLQCCYSSLLSNCLPQQYHPPTEVNERPTPALTPFPCLVGLEYKPASRHTISPFTGFFRYCDSSFLISPGELGLTKGKSIKTIQSRVKNIPARFREPLA